MERIEHETWLNVKARTSKFRRIACPRLTGVPLRENLETLRIWESKRRLRLVHPKTKVRRLQVRIAKAVALCYSRGAPQGCPYGMLEPYDGKLSRTVLRGAGGRKASGLPGVISGSGRSPSV